MRARHFDIGRSEQNQILHAIGVNITHQPQGAAITVFGYEIAKDRPRRFEAARSSEGAEDGLLTKTKDVLKSVAIEVDHETGVDTNAPSGIVAEIS